MSLRGRIKSYMFNNNLTQYDIAKMINVSQSTVSRFLNGSESIDPDTVSSFEAIVYPKKLVYLLSIERDGVVRYCYSYSPEVSPETIYWDTAENDRMSLPYGFRSYKQAEWMFHQWENRRGKDGWHYSIKEAVV